MDVYIRQHFWRCQFAQRSFLADPAQYRCIGPNRPQLPGQAQARIITMNENDSASSNDQRTGPPLTLLFDFLGSGFTFRRFPPTTFVILGDPTLFSGPPSFSHGEPTGAFSIPSVDTSMASLPSNAGRDRTFSPKQDQGKFTPAHGVKGMLFRILTDGRLLFQRLRAFRRGFDQG